MGFVADLFTGGDDPHAGAKRYTVSPQAAQASVEGRTVNAQERQILDRNAAEIERLTQQMNQTQGMGKFALAAKIQNLKQQNKDLFLGNNQSLAQRLSDISAGQNTRLQGVAGQIDPNMDQLLNAGELQRLSDLGLGRGTTTAELAGNAQRQGLARDIAAQAAGSGALNNAALARQAMMQQAGLGQDMAAQTAANASQERLNALGAALSTKGTALQNQFSQQLQKQGFLEDMRNQMIANKQNAFGASLKPHEINAGIGSTAIATKPESTNASMGVLSGFADMAGSGMKAMGLFGGSDARIKAKVKDSRSDLKKFLGTLKPYQYEYKKSHKDHPFCGKGRRTSVMAQDLEKAGPIGRQMVIDTPAGKMVDYAKGLPAMLSAIVDINERLEKKGKKGRK